MKKTNLLTKQTFSKAVIPLLLITCSSMATFAGDQNIKPTVKAKEGGGGDDACQLYYDNLASISRTFRILGQKLIDKYDPIIDVDAFSAAVGKVKCLPVKELPDELKAKTTVDENGNITTYLLWEHYLKQTTEAQHKLPIHEISIAKGWEGEGRYHVSNQGFRAFSSSAAWRTQKFCSDIRYEGNDTICFWPIFPTKSFAYMSEVHLSRYSSLLGACKYIGLPSYVSYTSSYVERPVAVIGGEGEFSEYLSKGKKELVLASIRCR